MRQVTYISFVDGEHYSTATSWAFVQGYFAAIVLVWLITFLV